MLDLYQFLCLYFVSSTSAPFHYKACLWLNSCTNGTRDIWFSSAICPKGRSILNVPNTCVKCSFQSVFCQAFRLNCLILWVWPFQETLTFAPSNRRPCWHAVLSVSTRAPGCAYSNKVYSCKGFYNVANLNRVDWISGSAPPALDTIDPRRLPLSMWSCRILRVLQNLISSVQSWHTRL